MLIVFSTFALKEFKEWLLPSVWTKMLYILIFKIDYILQFCEQIYRGPNSKPISRRAKVTMRKNLLFWTQ